MSRALAVAAAALASLGISACGVPASAQPHGSADATAPGVIPFVQLAGKPMSTTPALTAQVACSAADLRVESLHAGAYHGDVTENLVLVNAGAQACYLPGVPAMTVRLRSGGEAAVAVPAGITQRVDLPSAGVRPPMGVDVMIGSTANCGGGGQRNLATSLVINAAAGGDVIVNGLALDVECGAAAALLFQAIDLSAGGPQSGLAQATLASLTASALAPAAAIPGTTVGYTVVLANPTGAAIALSPCPSYTQGVASEGDVLAQETLLLNCQRLASIAAHSSVTFAMELLVPLTAPIGTLKFFWDLQVPDGPAVGGVIEVT